MKRTFNYKGVRTNSLGVPIFLLPSNVKKENRKRKFYNIAFSSPFEKESPKNLIVTYDIHEDRKKERDWFRRHLKKFNYIMIQRSVWVGPSPLPKEFLNYIKEIKLHANVKTFRLARPYDGKLGNIQ